MVSPARTVLEQLAKAAARKYGVDEQVFLAQIMQESGWDVNAISSAGAQGLAQFMPATARDFGIDPFNPEQALDGAARYMRQGLDRYKGDYRKALAAYNAGFGNVDKYGDVPPFEETQLYVKNILGESMPPPEGKSKGKSLLDRFNEWAGTDPAKGKISNKDAVKRGATAGVLAGVSSAGAGTVGRLGAGAIAKTGVGRAVASANRAINIPKAVGKLTPKSTKGKITQAGVIAGGGVLGDRYLDAEYGDEDAQVSGQSADKELEKAAWDILLRAIAGSGKNLTSAQSAALVERIKNGDYGTDPEVVLSAITREITTIGSDSAGGIDYKSLAALIARRFGISEADALTVLENTDDLNDAIDFFGDIEAEDDPDLDSFEDDTTGERVFYNPKTGEEKRRVQTGFAAQDPAISTVTDKRTGKTYRINTRTGQQDELGQFAYPDQDPNLATVTDKRTGQTYRINTQTGQKQDLGQFDYAGIDPSVTRQDTLNQQATNNQIAQGSLDVSRGNLGVNQGNLKVAQNNQVLDQQKYVADVLRRPSDFIARAFEQRGSLSPQARVTQADLINNLKAGIQQYASGGFTQEGKFITGDSKSGKPTGNEEMIVNPTNAPLMVVPNEEMGSMGGMPSYAYGTFGPDTEQGAKDSYYKAQEDAYGGAGMEVPAGLGNPTYNVGGQMVDKGTFSSWAQSVGSMNARRERNRPVTQEELINLGKQNLAPGASAALYGGRIPSARPVGQLTLGRLSRLAPGELQALNTQLGVEFNTDLENEIALLQQRFGPVVNRARGRLQV